jgi:hypothetical protein
VAGLCPRSGDVEAPPKPGSNLSSMAEAEPELLGRARRRLFGRCQGGVRALGRAERSSPSSGALARVRAVGRAELPMAPLARPDCLSVSLCQVALQSEWRRRRCPSVRPVNGAAK